MSEYLSARRRESLRLDLEDQQKTLIEAVDCLSRRLISGVPVSRDFEVAEHSSPVVPISVGLARDLARQVGRLRDVSRALARIGHPDFGVCARCGRPIPFAELARDATRTACRGGCADCTIRAVD